MTGMERDQITSKNEHISAKGNTEFGERGDRSKRRGDVWMSPIRIKRKDDEQSS